MDLQEIIARILDHVRGMWRYRWHLIIVAWLIAVPGWVMVYKMPNVYEASAKVSVDTNSLLPASDKGPHGQRKHQRRGRPRQQGNADAPEPGGSRPPDGP